MENIIIQSQGCYYY